MGSLSFQFTAVVSLVFKLLKQNNETLENQFVCWTIFKSVLKKVENFYNILILKNIRRPYLQVRFAAY